MSRLLVRVVRWNHHPRKESYETTIKTRLKPAVPPAKKWSLIFIKL
jgi:hypothetical protein